ncbi:hypothetical protein GGR57DRAFT_447611 [Xylariaceae sp. FL1272]|nr:hypothetical protein GGR57DRAFT_447611 [Xylariaceae sp. FL1272]
MCSRSCQAWVRCPLILLVACPSTVELDRNCRAPIFRKSKHCSIYEGNRRLIAQCLSLGSDKHSIYFGRIDTSQVLGLV